MTNFFKTFNMPYAKAICYSGFRNGQQPGGINPSYEEIKEDLLLLKSHWKYLRLYDCDEHALTVIKVIKDEKLDFKLMLGAYIVAEMNNYGCPWNGGIYEEKQLKENKMREGRGKGRNFSQAIWKKKSANCPAARTKASPCVCIGFLNDIGCYQANDDRI